MMLKTNKLSIKNKKVLKLCFQLSLPFACFGVTLAYFSGKINKNQILFYIPQSVAEVSLSFAKVDILMNTFIYYLFDNTKLY